MLPLALLITVVTLVALGGGAVVWMVLGGVIAPGLATGGALVVLLGSCVALGSLLARARARRTERDIHTIRRSQSIRERQPLRYRIDDEPEHDAEPALIRPLPTAGLEAGSPSPDETGTTIDEARLALWLEPIVAMPRNETDAWLAVPGDGERAMDLLDARGHDAVTQLWTIRAAMRLVGKLDHPIIVRVGTALLDDRTKVMELRSLVEGDPASATRLVLAVGSAPLDVLAAGRLEDLVDEGVGLALLDPELQDLDRAFASDAAERGVGSALLAAQTLDGPMAGRPVRFLAEAGVETIAFDVPDEDTMLRLADLGIARFAGPAFGRPRRANLLADGRARGAALPRRPDEEALRTVDREA